MNKIKVYSKVRKNLQKYASGVDQLLNAGDHFKLKMLCASVR